MHNQGTFETQETDMNGFSKVVIHKNDVVAGDLVLRDGHWSTVCEKDLRNDELLGRTIFGCAYFGLPNWNIEVMRPTLRVYGKTF